METVEFPAKLVGFRLDAEKAHIHLYSDIPILCSEQDVERRLNMYRSLESGSRVHYTWVPVALKELETRMAAIRADLERQLAEIQAWKAAQVKPEPQPSIWDQAVDEALVLAQERFKSEPQVLKRLVKAAALARAHRWHRLPDPQDTWLITGTELGTVYSVNGRCTCPDYEHGATGGWCKHRLARALAKKADAILRAKPVAQLSGGNAAQAQRIEIVMAYEASEAKVLSHTNGDGVLVTFTADGKQTESPTQTVPDLYRWLQANGYVPSGFQWLGWEKGLRQRRQTYVKQPAN